MRIHLDSWFDQMRSNIPNVNLGLRYLEIGLANYYWSITLGKICALADSRKKSGNYLTRQFFSDVRYFLGRLLSVPGSTKSMRLLINSSAVRLDWVNPVLECFLVPASM